MAIAIYVSNDGKTYGNKPVFSGIAVNIQIADIPPNKLISVSEDGRNYKSVFSGIAVNIQIADLENKKNKTLYVSKDGVKFQPNPIYNDAATNFFINFPATGNGNKVVYVSKDGVKFQPNPIYNDAATNFFIVLTSIASPPTSGTTTAASPEKQGTGPVQQKPSQHKKPPKQQEQTKADREKETKHQIIERYPSAKFPDNVVLYETVPLEIMIKAVQNLASHAQTPIKLSVSPGEKETSVLALVASSGFEIVGKNFATINVPVKAEDSKPVSFDFKAKKEGMQTIEVHFVQQDNCVGTIKIESLVLPSKPEFPSHTIKQWKSADKLPHEIIDGPDITIIILEKEDYEYAVLVSSKEIPLQEMSSIKFHGNPEAKFDKIFEDIENLNLPADTVDRKIRSKATSLYDELFPEPLKKLYWEKRDKIKSIRVMSKEPWVPWEIIKPHRKLDNGASEEDEYLCERYDFSRWIVGKTDSIKKQLKRLKVIVPKDTNLASALKERKWIEQFAKSRGLDVSFNSSYDEVLDTLEKGGVDLLHFSTHGERNKDNSTLSAIDLEGRIQLRPEDISGAATNFGNSLPFVILNACQTGNQGFSLTGVQGWATKFLSAGASVFIGTLWSVSDEIAFRFIQELYNELSRGTTLGESVRKARNACKQSGDPSWLAYQLYGHPNVAINFGYAMATRKT